MARVSTPATPSYGVPATPGPQPPALWDPTVERPLGEEQVKQWQTRVERGMAKDKHYHPQWERGLNRYAKALTPAPTGDDISALLDYRHVEGSKAALYHRTPEVNLIPVDPQDQAVPYNLILPLREKVLNHELGPDRANAKRALHKTLIDTIAASGYLICEIGFEQVTLPTQTMQPGMFGSAPVPVTVQVPVWSRRFIEAVSSKRLVKPADFLDTDFDKAPWLGITGAIPIPEARRLGWKLPEDFTGTLTRDTETKYDDGVPSEDAIDAMCEYTKVYYLASLYDPAVFNPDLYRCLILVKGLDEPAWHRDSPYQTLTPEGALTDDSMIGNPIHVDTLRDLIDSANVPSDLVVIEKESVELDKFRTTMTRNRRARRSTTVVNESLGQTTIDKLIENAGPVPIPTEYFDGTPGSRAMAVIGGQSEPRDNYTAQQIIEHDVELAVGRSPNQGGQYTNKKATATESKIVQANSKARASTDVDRVREYFQRLVRKFDAVLQRTMTQQELVKILGQQGALLWEQWRALPGKYAYKIQPDSGKFVDADEYRIQKVNEYNLFRKDPLVNATELLNQVFTALGYDAGKLVLPPQPEKPKPAKISLSMSVDNAMALPAEMQLLFVILETQGYVIPPELQGLLLLQAEVRQQTMALEAQNPEHGGPANKTERIDKRSSERTGGTEGIGKTGVAA
jgi:hypothetical protein